MNRACRGLVPLVLIAALSHAAPAAQGTDAGGFIQRWLLLEPIRVPGQLTESAVRTAVEKDFPVPAPPLPHDGDKLTVGDRSLALRPGAPSIIAGRRDTEHVTHQRHGIVGAAIFDEAESHVRVPAKIAIDFFKMSRSMRSRSFSRCKRAISAAWSADGSAACVVGRRVAAVGSSRAPRCSTHRRSTESRRPSSLATDPIERPLDATRSTACRL